MCIHTCKVCDITMCLICTQASEEKKEEKKHNRDRKQRGGSDSSSSEPNPPSTVLSSASSSCSLRPHCPSSPHPPRCSSCPWAVALQSPRPTPFLKGRGISLRAPPCEPPPAFERVQAGGWGGVGAGGCLSLFRSTSVSSKTLTLVSKANHT